MSESDSAVDINDDLSLDNYSDTTSIDQEFEFDDKNEYPELERFEILIKKAELYSQLVKETDYLSKDDNATKTIKEESATNDKMGSINNAILRKVTFLHSSPDFIQNRTLRYYQIQGLNWLIFLYDNGINGILADEMGLGKTIQAIALLGYLKHTRNVPGPYMVVAPKTTLNNWEREIKNYCPSLRTIVLIGDKNERKQLVKNGFRVRNWDVCITSYEMVMIEKSLLCKVHWTYTIVDEAHRLKNEKAKTSLDIRDIASAKKLLLTGTPLQNNLHELWSLLNFLLPNYFKNSKDFHAIFNTNLLSDDVRAIQRLHSVLQPLMLRRLKSEVEKSLKPKLEVQLYVGMAKFQTEWYTKILMNNMDVLNDKGILNKVKLQNIVMHLRKCTNHPYLFRGAELGPPYTIGDHIINNCGKMSLLNKLLSKLKLQGSRVLLFSQMVHMIDILEDYCTWKKYSFCRLDGNTTMEDRNQQIDEFNAPGSDKFIFLLSTRAGGLGINLATADVVIFYDSDWNPKVDLQAMDRSHRIGQKKQVRVFRLITENTVEERLIEIAKSKLDLDNIVIEQLKWTSHDLKSIINHGAKYVLSSKCCGITDEDIDTILLKGELKTKQQAATLSDVTVSGPNQVAIIRPRDQVYHFEGTNYKETRKLEMRKQEENIVIEPRLRKRRKLLYTYDLQEL